MPETVLAPGARIECRSAEWLVHNLGRSSDAQQVVDVVGVSPFLREKEARFLVQVDQQPAACQEPAAWIKRARDRKLAIPICADLLGPEWLTSNALVPLPEQPPLVEQLWLLLPQGAVNTKATRQCLRQPRVQITKTKTMQDPHGNNC